MTLLLTVVHVPLPQYAKKSVPLNALQIQEGRVCRSAARRAASPGDVGKPSLAAQHSFVHTTNKSVSQTQEQSVSPVNVL